MVKHESPAGLPPVIRPRGTTLVALAVGLAAFAALAGAARVGDRARIDGRPYVVDGDSLRFGARDVRLKGIDAPELRQTCDLDGRAYECGRTARAELSRLIGGRAVTCEAQRRDRFGRVVARCRAGDEDLAAAMVRGGHAVAFRDYLAEEAEARAAKRGIWASKFDLPRAWRAANRGRT